MNKTNIEYIDYSWNPLAMRCTPVSEGCANCWHITMADRLAKNPTISGYHQKSYRGESPPTLIQERLNDPLKRKKPSIIGVQFMGDLFHKDIADHQINSVFIMMPHFDWHIYLILTKRPKRMADFISIGTGWRGRLPHVWFGVSAENQQRADERIPILLQIPAAKRFVSIEPMLGPMDINPYFFWEWTLRGHDHTTEKTTGLDWVIVGGESGPGARPMHPDWPRSVRDQCQEAGVPFFFKQWGEWKAHSERLGGGIFIKPDGRKTCQGDYWDGRAAAMNRVGKKQAGRLLDGQEWNERPE